MSTSLKIVLVLLALSLLGLALTGLQIYSQLSYLWVFLLGTSWAWSKLALRGVSVRRTTRSTRANVGQIFEERFIVESTGILPRLWLQVRDQSDLPGSKGSSVMTMVGARETRSYRARTRLVQRGVFSLGPMELVSGDLFGLFPVRRTVPAEGDLIVYPRMVDVDAFPNPPGLLPGGEALRLRTHQVTPNAAGVREYVSGDPLKSIHWLSTARRNMLMTKEFELDPLAEVWIFLDAERRVQAGQPHAVPDHTGEPLWRRVREIELPPATEEYGVSVAASLARYFLRGNRAIGFASHHRARRETPDILSPDRGGRQLGKTLELLAPLRAEGDLPISALVTAHAQHIPRGSAVIIITPSVEGEVALMADLLIQRGLSPIAVLLDAASFGGEVGMEALATALAALGVPVCEVAKGDNLVSALSCDLDGYRARSTHLRPQMARRIVRR